MSYNWTEFVDLAHELAGIPPEHSVTDVAKLRAAISRAYYGAYHNAYITAQMKDNYIPAAGSGLHESLVRHFLNHPDTVRQSIGYNLQRLRLQRVRADNHHS